MFEIRDLQPEDIMAIKDNLIEPDKGLCFTPDFAEAVIRLGKAETFLLKGEIVAILGAISHDNGWEIWALYSNKFSCFTRARAALAFKARRIRLDGRPMFISIPSDLPNGDKYASFLGGKFVRKEISKLFAGIENSIYEVS